MKTTNSKKKFLALFLSVVLLIISIPVYAESGELRKQQMECISFAPKPEKRMAMFFQLQRLMQRTTKT